MDTTIKEIPKELLHRSTVQEALIFISEQDISTIYKVALLIGFGRKINRIFSMDEIEFALKDHSVDNVETE